MICEKLKKRNVFGDSLKILQRIQQNDKKIGYFQEMHLFYSKNNIRKLYTFGYLAQKKITHKICFYNIFF